MCWKDAEEDEEPTGKLDEEIDSFPTEAVEIVKYFDGFNPHRKQGRIYLRVRIYSFDQEKTAHKMKIWAQMRRSNFQKCIIQAVNSTNIGWLVYSSQYTDMDHLMRFLKEKVLDIEWGIKIAAVTNTDIFVDESKATKTPWKDRLKALTLHVPTKNANLATTKALDTFIPRSFFCKKNRYPLFAERMLFTQHEYDMVEVMEKRKYTTLLKRQAFHNRHLIPVLCNEIDVDLDHQFTLKSGEDMSLRQMILSITSHIEGPAKEARLFHSVDFCKDTQELWIGNRKGPGGSTFIFTFYQQFEGEARQMIKGLGVYLATKYGS